MAVRCADRDSFAEPDPDWLRDLPAAKAGVKPQPETIPLPPNKPRESSGAAPEPAAEPQPHADAAPVDSADAGAKPALGKGFELEPKTAPAVKSDESEKPALPGLEPPAEKSPPMSDRNTASPPLVIPDNN